LLVVRDPLIQAPPADPARAPRSGHGATRGEPFQKRSLSGDGARAGLSRSCPFFTRAACATFDPALPSKS
jgi:hypothetical protein